MRFLILFLTLILAGCTTTSGTIPDTSNPKKKIENAYRLRDRGQVMEAQALVREALAIFQAKQKEALVAAQINKNKHGEAESYLAFGDLYKSPNYQKAAELFKSQNDYMSYQDSADYYQKASDLYYEVGDKFMASWALMGKGDAFYSAEDIKGACSAYIQAEKIAEEVKRNKHRLTSSIKVFRNHVQCN